MVLQALEDEVKPHVRATADGFHFGMFPIAMHTGGGASREYKRTPAIVELRCALAVRAYARPGESRSFSSS
jgi:hypothetical protein